MDKFNELIKRTADLLFEADPGGDPSLGGAPEGMPAPGPETSPTQVPQVTKLTPEGKRFLVELTLKALAFDPDNMTDHDKSIFDETITPENAEDILSRIKTILVGSGVDSSDNDGSV